MEPVLEPNPTTGPPGTMLLHVRVSGRMPQAGPNPKDSRSFQQPDVTRFWLDPTRNCAIKRWDMLSTGAQGEEVVMSSHVIEKMEESPKGIWYASLVRVTSKLPRGEESVQVVRIYVDFGADLPDALFEPPKVGMAY